MDFELCVAVLSLLQPSLLGVVLYCVSYRSLTLGFMGVFATQGRARLRSTRHFECSAYSRLVGKFRYDLPV